MKLLFTFLAFLFSIAANAQIINFKVEGAVTDTTGVKFAYLTTLSQQISASSDKLFLKVPVVNGKFVFISHFDLEGKSMQQAYIFLDKRSNITKEEVALKFANSIWTVDTTGMTPHLLKIILQDISLQVENKQQMYKANITGGGLYTKHYRERSLALKKGRKGQVEFIRTHRDSPISLITIFEMYPPEAGETLPANETKLALFNTLSPQIKATKDGLALKKSLIR